MSLPPHSWHFVCATSSFTGSVRQDSGAYSWNENENWRCSTHKDRHMVIFPRRSSLCVDVFGSGEQISWESWWDPRCQHAPAVSEHPQTVWLSYKVSSPDCISVLFCFVFVAEHTHTFSKLQTFLGSSVNLKVSFWFIVGFCLVV